MCSSRQQIRSPSLPLREYDDGAPLNALSLPNRPVSMPLDDVSKRQLAHAYRLIRHKYGKGECFSVSQAANALKEVLQLSYAQVG